MLNLKNIIRNWCLKHCFNCLVVDDIVSFDKLGNCILRGQKLSPQELKNVKEEINFLQDSILWKILSVYVAQEARKLIFEKSQNFEEVLSGKLMLYNLNVQLKIIEKLRNSK